MKDKTVYMCQSCGNEFPKWAGQCSACSEWNTLKEFSFSSSEITAKKQGKSIQKFSIQDIQNNAEDSRIISGIHEFDRVIGGGIIPDSFILLTGDPGVGKSTLALQVAIKISKTKNVLYISGEESVNQVVSRVKRLEGEALMKTESPYNIHFASENNLENIFVTLDTSKIDFVIIDSIQTIYSNTMPSVAGSSSQLRFCAEALMQYIKKRGFACLLIGHVTKDGNLAGPQTLAHLVDTVLYLEGDKYNVFRMLRGQKNRFGSTSEIGVFEMEGEGLKEVLNPSASFLEGRMANAEGSVIIPLIEGTRPFLVELQALSTKSNFGYPKRTASGVDINRLHLMLAVLQKHGNASLESMDVFVNVVGGYKISEPAADLGLILALASSKYKKPFTKNMFVCGEVGLSGEVRAVSHIEKRLQEAEKMGFTTAVIPYAKKKPQTKLRLFMIHTVKEALETL